MARVLRTLLRGISIKRKLLVIFTVFVIVPILALSYYFSHNLAGNIMDSSIRFYGSSMEQLKHNITTKLEQYCEIMVSTASDKDLVNFMGSDYASDLQAYLAYQEKILPVLKRMQHVQSDLRYLLMTDKRYQSRISSFIETNNARPLFKSAYLAYGREKQPLIQWLGIDFVKKVNEKYYNNIVFCFPVMDFNDSGGKLLGLLFFMLDEDALYSLMNMEKTAGSNVIVVTDDRDRIVTGTPRELVGHAGADFAALLAEKGDRRLADYNGETYIRLVSEINDADIDIHGWKITFMIPFEEVQRNIDGVWRTSALIALICIAVSFGLIMLFLNNFSRKINRLVGNFKTVGEGDFTVRKADEGGDEIALLDRNFQAMVVKLNRLIEQVYESQLMLKEAEIESHKAKSLRNSAELTALQNQINPHYLFNTLETIRMNLVIRGDRETADIVEIFSESFRNNLSKRGDFIRIREELEFVGSYLRIQKYRYGDKIRYAIRIDKELEESLIPRFILQPLIENSIYHGLEMKDGNGNLRVEIVREGGDICITVTDDGVGMDEETVRDIYEKAESGTGEGGFSALVNIMQRLRLIYGRQYRLCIDSKKGTYTRVTISLPFSDVPAALPGGTETGDIGA